MYRDTSPARRDWQKIVESQGLGFQSHVAPGDKGRPYWDESAHYVFAMDEVLLLESQVEELHRMCLDAVQHVIKKNWYAGFGIPDWLAPAVAASWKRRDPHVFGRFDLCYDGRGHAKLLEYNADTPTSLVEASSIQWHWLQDVFPHNDQWNSLHEKLIARWRHVSRPGEVIHFSWDANETAGEDVLNAAYMQEVATQAGARTKLLAMQDVGWDGERFVDLDGTFINRMAKLYPWEWLTEEQFGRHAVERQRATAWVEPLWKMLLSNKALLAVLWELYPGHPNLLPAYLDGPRDMSSYIAKPLLGREGASMRIVTPGKTICTPGDYGSEGYVYQEFWPLPDFDGWRPVLGAWVVGDEAAGVGIRETVDLITGNGSSFVPHRIEG